MIKFKRYQESRIGDCQLTAPECQALLMRILRRGMIKYAKDHNYDTRETYGNIWHGLALNPDHWSHGYRDSETIFRFGEGGPDSNIGYLYTAEFRVFTDFYGDARIIVTVYVGNPEDERVLIYEMLSSEDTDDFVDYLTYEDPEWID